MSHPKDLALILFLAVASGACNGAEPVMPLDVDAPPITEGDWYRPGVSTTWQWQLLGTVNTGYDVDLYDVDLFDAPAALITELQGAGRKVICYFSAGSSEDWRDDSDAFKDDDMGESLDGWDGERWLDIRSTNVHSIIKARLDIAVDKGCDGVEPDNVDGYTNDTGFSLTAKDQLAYNRFVANEAHDRDLAVGLKNDGGQVRELVDYYDFELNEECHQFNECAELLPFVSAGKPVFNAEYPGSASAAASQKDAICAAALASDIRTLILPLDLDDSFRVSCD
ncbi:MAG: endo alpha-1,4 polygalactosaminidase [Planctomycetota bacterium]|jgi:hypothetical protein